MNSDNNGNDGTASRQVTTSENSSSQCTSKNSDSQARAESGSSADSEGSTSSSSDSEGRATGRSLQKKNQESAGDDPLNENKERIKFLKSFLRTLSAGTNKRVLTTADLKKKRERKREVNRASSRRKRIRMLQQRDTLVRECESLESMTAELRRENEALAVRVQVELAKKSLHANPAQAVALPSLHQAQGVLSHPPLAPPPAVPRALEHDTGQGSQALLFSLSQLLGQQQTVSAGTNAAANVPAQAPQVARRDYQTGALQSLLASLSQSADSISQGTSRPCPAQQPHTPELSSFISTLLQSSQGNERQDSVIQPQDPSANLLLLIAQSLSSTSTSGSQPSQPTNNHNPSQVPSEELLSIVLRILAILGLAQNMASASQR